MVADFPIYFNDLNEDAQKRILEFVGETDPKEMNWDIDMCPIAIYSYEKDFDINNYKNLKPYTGADSNG